MSVRASRRGVPMQENAAVAVEALGRSYAHGKERSRRWRESLRDRERRRFGIVGPSGAASPPARDRRRAHRATAGQVTVAGRRGATGGTLRLMPSATCAAGAGARHAPRARLPGTQRGRGGPRMLFERFGLDEFARGTDELSAHAPARRVRPHLIAETDAALYERRVLDAITRRIAEDARGARAVQERAARDARKRRASCPRAVMTARPGRVRAGRREAGADRDGTSSPRGVRAPAPLALERFMRSAASIDRDGPPAASWRALVAAWEIAAGRRVRTNAARSSG